MEESSLLAKIKNTDNGDVLYEAVFGKIIVGGSKGNSNDTLFSTNVPIDKQNAIMTQLCKLYKNVGCNGQTTELKVYGNISNNRKKTYISSEDIISSSSSSSSLDCKLSCIKIEQVQLSSPLQPNAIFKTKQLKTIFTNGVDNIICEQTGESLRLYAPRLEPLIVVMHMLMLL